MSPLSLQGVREGRVRGGRESLIDVSPLGLVQSPESLLLLLVGLRGMLGSSFTVVKSLLLTLESPQFIERVPMW